MPTKVAKKIKVLFLFHDTDANSGASHSLMDIIDFLDSSGKVSVYVSFPSKTGSNVDHAKAKGYKVFTKKYGWWCYPKNNKRALSIKWFLKYFLNYPVARYFSKVVNDEGIEIVYTNTSVLFLGALIKKRNKKVKHIWNIREFGEEDHNLGLMFGWNRLCKYMNRYADEIIFISKSLKNKYENDIIDKNKIVVLYNDIKYNGSEIKRDFKNKTFYNILIAGSIIEGKNQLDAVSAVKILRDELLFDRLRLYIAGRVSDNSYYNKLIDYVKKNDLEKYVEFVGFVEDMATLREKMDIGIVSSSSEAFGRVTVEGMMSGMLMIGADAAGTSELINDGETGFLYKLHDYTQLANILYDAIQNPAKAQRIAKNGFNFAVNNFGKNKTSTEILKIMEVLSGHL